MERITKVHPRVILAPDELQAKLLQLYLVIRPLKRMDAAWASHVPGSSKKKKKKRSLNSKNDRRSLSPGKQSDGSKRHLSSGRFEEFGDDIGRKATESRRRSLSPKKEPGYSSSPCVSRSVQSLHSSSAQGPQLDMRPLPCDEMAIGKNGCGLRVSRLTTFPSALSGSEMETWMDT